MTDRTLCPGRPGAHHPDRVGTATAYWQWGCRCPDAREDKRIRAKRYRHRRAIPVYVDATKARRMLQALACRGFSCQSMHEMKGSPRRLHDIRDGKQPTLRRDVEAWVIDFYRRHEHREAPFTSGPGQARALARRKGWAPPEAWDPDTIGDPDATPQHLAEDTNTASTNTSVDLELALSGRLRIPPSARRRAIHCLAIPILSRRVGPDGTQWGAERIAEHLGVSARYVQRVRAELRALEQDQNDETPTPTTSEEAA